MLYNIKNNIFFSIFIIFAFSPSYSGAETEINFFERANKIINQSDLTGQEARKAIVDANAMRKDILLLRAKARKAHDAQNKKKNTESANNLVSTLKNLQSVGSSLREKETELFKTSLNYLEEGMIHTLGEKIRNRNPILMADSTTLFFAHNTRFRSIHPKMLNQMGTALENRSQEVATDSDSSKNISDKEMSLLIPALAEQNAPQELDISSFQISREHQYFAHIEVMTESNIDIDKLDYDSTSTQKGSLNTIASNTVPSNTIHSWLLMLIDLNGNLIEKAKIDVIGHMPGHVHGLPTQPRVTQEIENGIYQVEGMKFQMKGWWVIQFNIEVLGRKADSITFNLVL